MSEPIDVIAHVKALGEKRMRANEEAKRIIDDAHAANRRLSAEEMQTLDRIDEDIAALKREAEIYHAAERRERESAELREASLSQYGEARVAKKEQTEADMLRAFLANRNAAPLEFDLRSAQKERELLRQGMSASEARALAWDTGSIASGVPITVSSTLYGYLEASIAMLRMPTTKFTTASGETMYFPKLAAHAIGTQVSGQGTTLAGTDPTFSRMQMDAYKYGELVKASSEVVQDTGFDVVGFVTRDVARAIGRVIDTDLVTGSGSNKPNGIMTAIGGAGTIATGGSLIDPSYEKLVDLVHSVADPYRNGGSAAWLMNDLTAAAIRKIRTDVGGTSGPVLWQPSLTMGIIPGQPDTLLGYPVYTDPNVASLASNAKVIAYGDWSAYYIRQVGNFMFDRDDSRYFDTDEVGFRGKWRVDGDCIDTAAINIMKRSV